MAATFAEFVRWPARSMVVLLELMPAYRLQGWSKTGGRTFVYQIAFAATERGGGSIPVYRQLTGVQQNGVALSVQSSIANVDATASSYFWDSAAGVLYVHTSGGVSPESYTSYLATLTLRMASTGIVLNLTDGDSSTGCYYHPWLSGGYDEFTAQMEDALTGIAITERASITLTNGHGFWHPVVANDGKYIWKNKTAKILIGGRYNGQDLPYSQYATWSTLLVDAVSSDEVACTFTLKPVTAAIEQTLPITPFFSDTYPNLGTGVEGTKKWIGYGRATIPADLTDTSGLGVYTLADAAFQTLFAVNAVLAVDATGVPVPLIAGVDYSVDLTLCTVTILNASYTWQAVKIWVDVTGKPDGLGSYLKTGPSIMRDILQTFLGVPTSQIDTVAFAAADVQAQQELAVWLKSPRQIASIFSGLEDGVPSIGKSIMATIQTTLAGLWTCFIWKPGVDIATALSLRKEDFTTFTAQPRYGTVYGGSRTFYGYDAARGAWASSSFNDPRTQYETGTTDVFDIYTFLTNAADAQRLAQRYQVISGAISLEVEFEERGALLASASPGDKVLVTYNPAPVAAGQMTTYPMELIRIDRSLVPVLKMAGRLGDLRGIGAKVGTWQNVGGAGLAWASASAQQQQLYGFWTDTNGYVVPGDESTRHRKLWW